MRFPHGLRVTMLAALAATLAVSVAAAPMAAADPSPAPVTPAASPDPTMAPSPSTVTPADPAPSPIPAADPAAASPATATPTVTAAARAAARGLRVARIALAQRHKRYARGATGPRAFDCSGLVRYAYRSAGVGGRLGGGHSARTMLRWARLHGLASRRSPRVGDVVIYGNGSHAAIYIGRGRVVSALNPRQGIRVTGLHALRARFTAFIHARLQ